MITALPLDLKEKVEAEIFAYEGKKVRVENFSSLAGGCINSSGKLITTKGNYFLKWNSLHRYPKLFESEKRGLLLLKSAAALSVPEIIGTGETEGFQFLVLSFIEEGRRRPNFWEALGRGVAKTHKQHNDSFGLDHNNYIGSLPQKNEESNSWTEFFINKRLEPQLVLAETNRLADPALRKRFERLYANLPSILNEDKPSLLHGDLWNGNVMSGMDGTPVIIDPATYYGSREMDLSMAILFGGFDDLFFHSYNEEFPLGNGFEVRARVYELYPLLVHVNLFGSPYLSQTTAILRGLGF